MDHFLRYLHVRRIPSLSDVNGSCQMSDGGYCPRCRTATYGEHECPKPEAPKADADDRLNIEHEHYAKPPKDRARIGLAEGMKGEYLLRMQDYAESVTAFADKCKQLEAILSEMDQNCMSRFLHETRMAELEARLSDLDADQKALKSKLAEKDSEVDQLNARLAESEGYRKTWIATQDKLTATEQRIKELELECIRQYRSGYDQGTEDKGECK
jgi:hypothetical protein